MTSGKMHARDCNHMVRRDDRRPLWPTPGLTCGARPSGRVVTAGVVPARAAGNFCPAGLCTPRGHAQEDHQDPQVLAKGSEAA